jgi:MATE family multidrug resistance protein
MHFSFPDHATPGERQGQPVATRARRSLFVRRGRAGGRAAADHPRPSRPLPHLAGRSVALLRALPLVTLRSRTEPATNGESVAVPPASGAVRVSDRELRSRVWSLALPAIGEQVLALGVGVSDTFLSGHLSQAASAHLGYGPAIAISAVGVAVTAVWVCLTAFFAVNVGVTALVARATGARDPALASRAAAQGILLGALIGAAMVALAVPLAEAITGALGVSGQVAALAAGYIRVFSLALPATGMASATTAAMRGAGDARRPLLVMLVVNGANIAGSWSLMNGLPALGIAPIGVLGSAVGAATGWVLGMTLAIFLLTRRHPRAPRLTRAALRPNRDVAARILRIGLPSAAELVVFQLGIVTFNRVVVALGADAYAANTTINTVENLGSLPGFGFAVATTALVGQALGAADPELAVRATFAALRPCFAVMGTMGLLAVLLPNVLLGLFVADPHVLDAGAVAMRLSILTLPASAIAFVFNGALRGAGDTRFPVIVRASGTWGIRVPLALRIIPLLALPGARLAMALDFSVQAGLSYWRFRSGKWRRARV